jgi:hypothetical protein
LGGWRASDRIKRSNLPSLASSRKYAARVDDDEHASGKYENRRSDLPK